MPHVAAARPRGEQGTPQTRDEMLARLAAVRQQIDARAAKIRPPPIKPALGADSQQPQQRWPPTRRPRGSVVRRSSKPRPGRRATTSRSSGKPGRATAGLDSQPEAPRTPFELRAGFVVPATLISGINSDLPGQIMAQVAQHVYDTPTGKHLLIPQGSRLVGTYSSDVAYGQARVLVAWQRIVFPDGKAMDIGAMPGADSAGYAGFNDQVNNHYLRTFGSAFLMSGVTAGITLSQDNGRFHRQLATRQRCLERSPRAAARPGHGTTRSPRT
jgi:type IV secretory pathway VirB10-like protein